MPADQHNAEKTIYLTEEDRDSLRRLIISRQPAHAEVKALVDLRAELERATIVEPKEMPPGVVTLGSRVRLRDLDTGRSGEYTLVMPGEANIRQAKVSVLAPVGTALLGQHEGDTVEWEVPVGRKRFEIEAVVFQPEAAGREEGQAV